MDTQRPTDRTVGEALARAVDAISDLIQLHLSLAKAEIRRDAARLGVDLLPVVLSVPLIVVGYLLLAFAASVALEPWLGAAGGLVVIGGLHVLVGGVALWMGVNRLRLGGPPALTITSELRRTALHVVVPNATDRNAVEVVDGP